MLTCSLIHTHWICSHVLWTFKPLSRSMLKRLFFCPNKRTDDTTEIDLDLHSISAELKATYQEIKAALK